jgi:hypothetical protein
MRTRNRIAGLLSVGAAACLLAAGLAAPANAGTSQVDVVNVHIRSRISDKCVAIGGGSTAIGAQAIQFTCSNGTEQQWDQQFIGFDIYDNPMYVFKRINHNLCLTSDGGNGGAVTQRTCDGNSRQRWSNDKSYRLRNVGSTYCLAVPGGSRADAVKLIGWTCGTGNEQDWWMY